MTDAEPTTAVLELRLLGPMEARVQGIALPPLRTRKDAWVLALLALHEGRPLDRAWLAGLLWPESTAATARAECASLERAVALYRGPFLDGCIEAWALPERARREEAYLCALERLAEHAAHRGDWQLAERYLRQALVVNPLRESVHRGLMQALACGGSHAAAIQIYRDLRVRLHRELNAVPDPETEALFRSLRHEAREESVRGAAADAAVQRAASSVQRESRPDAARCSLHAARERTAHASAASGRQLPTPLTRFVGRRREIDALLRLLPHRRLVTLTGPGGSGKTRLALQVAHTVRRRSPRSVCLLELASLADLERLPATLAGALGLREQPGISPVALLTRALADGDLFRVLDNCEHLLDACAPLADTLLRHCPRLTLLATSREALGVPGEQILPVPPLELPATGTVAPADLLRSEAVQLFLDRALLGRPEFALLEENAAAVAAICRQVEGMPLAIKLAAARVQAVSVGEVAARLTDRLGLLVGAFSRTAPARHQTLRATIDWSYEMLAEPEGALLRRLSVFAGGATLPAVEAVCAGEGVETRAIIDLVTRLVRKSLVVYEEVAGEGRYRLLEVVREYASEKLEEAGETGSVRQRHAQFFLELAERARSEYFSPAQSAWTDRLEREQNNSRAALDWCLASGETEIGLRLATALMSFWADRGYAAEGRLRLARLLALPGAAQADALRMDALGVAGWLAHRQNDQEDARRFFEECLVIARGLGEEPKIASVYHSLGTIASCQSDLSSARHFLEESLARARVRRRFPDRSDAP